MIPLYVALGMEQNRSVAVTVWVANIVAKNQSSPTDVVDAILHGDARGLALTEKEKVFAAFVAGRSIGIMETCAQF
jgi:hypothetical protein